jgi:hypothetical protein
MNEQRFMELLAAYGAELSRWPADERVAAEEMLEFGPHRLKDLWESERVFDRLLSLEKDVPASINLETRVLSSATERRAGLVRRTPRWSMRKWAAGGAVAASLALGFAVGYAGEPEPVQSAASNVAPQMLALSESGSAMVLLSAEPTAN